ncbi:hypothetical protein EGW08_017881 [Elysia chlorotica]|uniref:Uncharacterized protein n=1 Tax=Elysia chlorotica TaxID=188477 RepID=A0A3S1B3V1_ELYCH|nr:hypothetical protein EGW08_017881 [Elysia chlorotica]
MPHPGIEYYRMSSGGQTSNCYPPGVMFAASPNSHADLLQHSGPAAAGTAVMIDASGHHHYTSVMYSTQPDLAMEAASLPPAALCVGEGHSSSSSNSFVAPLSSSSSLFTPNYSTSISAATSTTKSSSSAQNRNAGQNSTSPTWAGKVKGKTAASNPTSSSSAVCNASVAQPATKTLSGNPDSQAKDVASMNSKNSAKSSESKSPPSKDGHTAIIDDDDNASDDCGMDVGSDRDSGCSSEYTNSSPTADDNSVTTIIGPTYPDAQELSSDAVSGEVDHDHDSTTDTVADGSTKPRGKRRYYMYGSHKLVKPIKEIPLRFQILLAETSAAKARCEGQPIYMQHQAPQQMYDVVYYQLPEAATPEQQTQAQQLNANANCFIPGQPGTPQDSSQMMGNPYECYSLCYPAGNTVPTNMHGYPPNPVQPTPLYIPPMQQNPPPSVPAPQSGSGPMNSQNCQTIIVYSSQASQANVTPSPANPASPQHIRPISMPPPPFPPPTSLPPPPTDPMSTNSTPCLSPHVNPVVVSLPTNPNHSKPHASSTYTKPQVVLSVPPPGHPPSHSSHNKSAAPVTQISAPPPNPCMLSTNPAYLQHVPQHIALTSSSQHQSISGVQTTSPSVPQHLSPASYPGSATSPYMYVYPSPPAGQQGVPTQVMYMVSPAYPANPTGYQQPVLVPSNCPVPVQ